MSKSRTAIALVVAMILTLIAPTLSVDVEAYSLVYYNVDFSEAFKKVAIKQQLSPDSGIISIANIESYMRGFTSTSDTMKVREEVAKINTDSASAGTNYSKLEKPANMGYTKKSYTLDVLYSEISRGNPVLIERNVNATGSRYAVVCGYDGSTTTLEQSGFIIVDCDTDTIKVCRLNTWAAGTTEIYSRVNGIPYSGVKGIALSVNYPDIVHKKNDGMGFYGRIDSDANITQVTVSIINAKTGTKECTKTVKPNSKTVKMFDNFNSAMKIDGLANGDYFYYIHAKNANNVVKTFSKYFQISDTAVATAPKAPKYTVKYDANGGTGTIASKNVEFGTDVITEKADKLSKEGYECIGWNLKRADGKWFVSGQGWKTESEISSNKYEKALYTIGEKYLFDDAWISGTNSLGNTFTFCAVWEKEPFKAGWYLINGKYYYCNADESYYTGWLNYEGHWYYLKETGEMATGWTRVNGKWYYMNVSGIMRTGWLSDAGHWYYLTSNGDMTIGWKNIDGKYYYFDKNGYMYTGWLKDAGKWYYLTDDGDMATGWKLISGKYYFFTSNGDMYTGWKQDAGKWYFLSDDGDMALGWKLISGTYYYFANTGEMLTGWVFDAGKWYYMDNSGAMVANKTMVIGGKAYWFEASGACMNP